MPIEHPKLMIPGPVDVGDEVLAALAEPPIPHYGPQWVTLYNETVANLKQVFATGNDLFLLAGPGTAGLDAALGSLLRTGEKVLIGQNGFFGERLGVVAQTYGLDVRPVSAPLGQPLDPEAIRRRLAAEPDIQAVAIVHLETSTGVLNPLAEIAAVVREFDALFIVDAVASLGGVPLPVDEWGVDVCVTVSNKCLAAPPGLAPISVSERAWRVMERKSGRAHGWYLNLRTWKDYATNWAAWHPHPTTLPTNIILALRASLDHILATGLEAYHARHVKAARLVRSRLQEWGFSLFPAERYAAPLVTAMRGLPGMDVDDMRRYLLEEWQIMVSGGIEELSGQIFRIGHIGRAASVEYGEALLQGIEAYLELEGR